MTFSTSNTLSFNMSGKFIAESDNWIHYTRQLKDYELMLVIKGTLYISNEKQNYTVHEGEYLLMEPSLIQKGFKPSRCSFYWLHFSCNHCEHKADAITIPQQFLLPAPERVIIFLKQLQDSDCRYENKKLNSILTAAILTEIELQTSKNYHSQNNITQEHLLLEIKDYIKWNLHRNIKIADIAAYFGYNEKYLTTLFHSVTGTALKQYVLQSKMEQAKIQLSDTNLQISQIAYNLGFEDSHNFSNAFKKITGLSPKEYKLNCGKEIINREN